MAGAGMWEREWGPPPCFGDFLLPLNDSHQSLSKPKRMSPYCQENTNNKALAIILGSLDLRNNQNTTSCLQSLPGYWNWGSLRKNPASAEWAARHTCSSPFSTAEVSSKFLLLEQLFWGWNAVWTILQNSFPEKYFGFIHRKLAFWCFMFSWLFSFWCLSVPTLLCLLVFLSLRTNGLSEIQATEHLTVHVLLPGKRWC